MLSASLHKSVTDLTRRRARTVFAVLTLALAVASISFFAVPTLIDRAMQDEVRAGRLADVTVAMRPLVLTDAELTVKFRDCATRVMPATKADELLGLVQGIEGLGDVSVLARALAGSAT